MKQSRKVGKKIIDEVEVQIQQLLQLRESLNQTTLQKRDELGLAQDEEEQQRAAKNQINILVSDDDDDGNNDDKAQHAVDADDDKTF